MEHSFQSELNLTAYATVTTGNLTVARERAVFVNKTSGAATTITLPPISAGSTGRRLITVLDQKGDAATNNITVTPNGGDTIMGAASYVIARNYGAVTLVDNGTEWDAVEGPPSGGVTPGTTKASSTLIAGASKQLDTLALANPVVGTTATAGSATQCLSLVLKKTAIADATATSILTVTCPNGENTAALRLTLLAAVNNSGTLDSARCALGMVVFDRTTGAALVGTAATLTTTAIATSGTATLTLAYSLGTVSGTVSATNTMDVKVTLTKTGGTNHQIVVLAELLNSEASGMTMVAA